ncbi:MAG: Gfo/Idh/MocA family protein [Massiliimalia sp.]|jgi:predicted dehydrogenase
MVKLALLSAWHVHTGWFADELKKSGLGEIVVVWDEDAQRGKEMAEHLSVAFEPDLETVLGREDVDGVMVECPTTKHRELIVKAAEAKKHIFSDKALALTSEDCQAIEEAVEKNGVKFLLSLESKIIGVYQQAIELVQQGKLGRVTSAYFRRAHQAALDPNMLPAYWFNTDETGGGVTLDLGCHGFYLLPEICGKPKKVTCLMNELYGTGSDENSTTVIEFENGAIGTSHTSFVSYRMDNLLEIVGTEGILVVSGADAGHYRMLLQSAHMPGYEELTPVPQEKLRKDDEFPIVKFAKLIQSDEKQIPEFSLDVAKTLTRLIECAYESAKTGQTVNF